MNSRSSSGLLSLGVAGAALILGLTGTPFGGWGEARSIIAAQPDALAEYIALDEDAEPLRSLFNADVGKVRILMLVAPT